MVIEEQTLLALIKITCMVTFFLMIAIVGNLPLRLHAFKSNQLLLSLTSAFAGGLFLSVGLLHLLPEAAASFDKYFEYEEKFPYAYLLVVVSFSVILFIEKIITPQVHVQSTLDQNLIQNDIQSDIDIKLNPWAPYILQVGIGIHAIFEGLSIGILKNVSLCFGVGVAVICHKWAEGLTLGLAFKQAGIDLKMSTIMIMIQAIMNPIGVGIGWILSQSGPLVEGIFVSISVGTFIYIASVEVIVEEFSIPRYKKQKFVFYILAILFVCSIWFIEQYISQL